MSTPARSADRSAFPLICTRIDSDELVFHAHGERVPLDVWEAPALHPKLRSALHALNAAQDRAAMANVGDTNVGREAA